MVPGKLIVISGPSGAGKSTVIKEVFECSDLPLQWSVSATTRPPRPGEVAGQDYHYMSSEEFERRREAGEFLETCEVFGRGYWYGTLQSEVTPRLEQGNWVVLEIDVDGTLAILERFPDAVTIFVRPSSIEQLGQRLTDRGTESPEEIGRRLDVARREMELEQHYRHTAINDDVPEAVAQICKILKSYQ